MLTLVILDGLLTNVPPVPSALAAEDDSPKHQDTDRCALYYEFMHYATP